MPSRSVALLDQKGQRQESGHTLTGNASAAASTPIAIGTVSNLARWDQLLVRLTSDGGNTGGTVDYVLQRLVDGPNGSTWDDYLYLGQAAAATALDLVAMIDNTDDFSSYGADKADVSWVRHDVNADATLVLAAGERRPGPLGNNTRLIARTGASVSAAAAVVMDITGYEKP